jgi:hypothetical protein
MNLVKSYRLTPAGYKKAYENGLCDVLSMPLGEEVVEWSNQMLPEDEREPSLVSQRLSDLSAQAVVEETLAQGLQPDEYQVRDHTAESHRFLTTAPAPSPWRRSESPRRAARCAWWASSTTRAIGR